ncbi:MAG: methylated-DNA--[protein]-cysteine S-methyltransferase [Gammaproteobacteria bacterium]|nr:methylated-DNA--[protein]-cysteine S-methyltransferase [Gammaproteobacteria bacterium]MDE2345108.1 methylated-DNA--[protein]-cysteine S-methyltransferase [Gammaproteobacteria bacterium]
MYYCTIASPVGALLLAGDELGLHTIGFQDGKHPCHPEKGWLKNPRPFKAAIAQLCEYFAGQRREFDVPLAPRGTEFQLRVWNALRAIPYGSTWSYGQLARRIRKPQAARAVGAANGQNPIPIIIPCHRVIGADGSLTGFGGGLKIKRQLLELEGGTRSLF